MQNKVMNEASKTSQTTSKDSSPPKSNKAQNQVKKPETKAMSAPPHNRSVQPTVKADNNMTTIRERRPAPKHALPDTFTDERDDVLAVINELEDQLDRYEDIRENLERELNEVREQDQAAKQRIQELEWQNVTLQTRVEALEQVRQEISLLEEEITDANTRSQRLGEQLSRSEKDTIRLTSELKAANKQLEELWATRKERDGLRADIKNASARLDQVERANKELQEERNSLLLKYQESQLGLDESRAARHQIEMDLRSSEDRNENLHANVEELQQKLDSLRGEKKKVQAQLTHLERENSPPDRATAVPRVRADIAPQHEPQRRVGPGERQEGIFRGPCRAGRNQDPGSTPGAGNPAPDARHAARRSGGKRSRSGRGGHPGDRRHDAG